MAKTNMYGAFNGHKLIKVSHSRKQLKRKYPNAEISRVMEHANDNLWLRNSKGVLLRAEES